MCIRDRCASTKWNSMQTAASNKRSRHWKVLHRFVWERNKSKPSCTSRLKLVKSFSHDCTKNVVSGQPVSISFWARGETMILKAILFIEVVDRFFSSQI